MIVDLFWNLAGVMFALAVGTLCTCAALAFVFWVFGAVGDE